MPRPSAASDETALFELAGVWTGMADQINASVDNSGDSFTAFATEWNDDDSAPRNISDAVNPATIVGMARPRPPVPGRESFSH